MTVDKLKDLATTLAKALQALYDKIEAERQWRQDCGLRTLEEAKRLGCATIFHPSQWAPVPEQIMAENALDEFKKMEKP